MGINQIKKSLLFRLLLRWLVSALGLWIAQSLLGTDHLKIGSGDWDTIAAAGLFLAVVNMALKPILVIFSFPAIIFTLGLFMVVVNALVIIITSWFYHPLIVKSFWSAVLAGIIVSIVNFLVTRIVEDL